MGRKGYGKGKKSMWLCMVTPKALIDLPFYFPNSTQRVPSNLLCMRWTAGRTSSPILPSFLQTRISHVLSLAASVSHSV